jgi:hypothetical protein
MSSRGSARAASTSTVSKFSLRAQQRKREHSDLDAAELVTRCSGAFGVGIGQRMQE